MATVRKTARKPKPKLRGRKQPLSLTLPPDLVEKLEAAAVEQDRSRAKMIEIAVRHYLATCVSGAVSVAIAPDSVAAR